MPIVKRPQLVVFDDRDGGGMDQDRSRRMSFKDRSARATARRGIGTLGRRQRKQRDERRQPVVHMVIAMGVVGVVLNGCTSRTSVSETGNGLRPAAPTSTMLGSCPPTPNPTNQPETATTTDSAGATPDPVPIDVQASSETGDPNAVRTDGVVEAPSAILVGPAASSAAASPDSGILLQSTEPAKPTPADTCGGAGSH